MRADFTTSFVRVAVRPTSIHVEAFCGVMAPGRDDFRCADGDMFDQVSITAPPEGSRPQAARVGK